MISPWRARSIRARLTAWYAAALTAMLAAYAGLTFVAVRHEFREQFDAELHRDFETAEAQLRWTADGALAWTVSPHGDGNGDGDRAIDVWTREGEPLLRDDASRTLPALAPGPRDGDTYTSIVVGAQPWRMLTGVAAVGGRPVTLRVSRSEAALRHQLQEVFAGLVVGLPLAVAFAVGGGYLLAARALAPIDDLAAAARRISAHNLHERVTAGHPGDEIGRLADVINDLLARIDASVALLRRFTADASHELRTPLAAMRGVGEAGLDGTRAAADYRDMLGSMLEEVDRLSRLVDTLLRLSQADAGATTLVRDDLDLGHLVDDVAASLQVLAEERSQRITVVAEPEVIVAADRQLLREALVNVLDNAIEYGPPGSAIELAVVREGDSAVASVSDRGPGIPTEFHARIFERFFRVDASRSRDRGGTGLGLAIAKWAVEANGGRIDVQRRTGGGSVFRVVLPVGTTGRKT